MNQSDDELHRLRKELEAKLGKEVLDKLDDLNRQSAEAAIRGDFDRAYEIDEEIERLIRGILGFDKGLNGPSPARQLTEFYEALTRTNESIESLTKVPDEGLKHIERKAQKVVPILLKLLPGPADAYERYAHDHEVIKHNIDLFDDETVSALLSEAEYYTTHEGMAEGTALFQRFFGRPGPIDEPRAALTFVERLYEIIQHIASLKEDKRLETFVCFQGGKLCEELGRFVGAMDWYEIARSAAESSGDEVNYLNATFNYARACMMYSALGLDYKITSLLEEAVSLAKQQNNREVLTRSLNLLIQLYEMKGEEDKVSELKRTLKENR